MKLIYNIHFDIAAVICLIVIAVYLKVQYVQHNRRSKMFRAAVFHGIILTLLDILAAYTLSSYEVVPVWINKLVNMSYFVLEGMVLFFFLYYVRSYLEGINRTISRMVRILDDIPLVLFMTVALLTPLTGWLFQITQEDGYTSGILHFLTYVVPAFYFIRALILLLQYRQYFQVRDRITMVAFIVAAGTAILLQTFVFPNILLCCFGMMIAILMILITMETPEYQKLIEAKKELEQAKEDAVLANQAKSVFLLNMSHEIRTPINGVLGLNALILREENVPPEVRECAINIQSSGRSLLSIINDILDVTKIESGDLELTPARYHLQSVINDVFQMISYRATDKNLYFKVSIDPSTPISLYGDAARVRQIMVNLLTNAVKYTERGTVHWTVGWDLAEDKTDEIILKIVVEDTGIGMTEESLKRLYGAFERMDIRKNRNVEGTGLGLRITKQLTNLMGGTIQVESEYGKGSTFTVRLPQKVESWEVIGLYVPHVADESKDNTYSFNAKGANILVVDDVPINLRVICGLLSDTQIHIDTASSGMETLEKAASKHYDIIFLNHMMPGMDGMETIERLKAIKDSPNAKTPIIMLTANAYVGAKEEYLNAGFSGYLSKPVKEVELRKSLVDFLPQEMLQW